MSGHRRNDVPSLADLHDDALRETDAEANEAAGRYMAWFDEAWFDEPGAPGAGGADRRRDGPARVARAVEAPASPESARFVPVSPRARISLVLPVALAAVAALAAWLVPRP